MATTTDLLSTCLEKNMLIAGKLRNEIHNGMLKPGELIKSENELCKLFEVSRQPVRQALASLVKEGLVYRVPGKGTFVKDRSAKLHMNAKKQITVVVDDIDNLDVNMCLMEIIQGLKDAAHPKEANFRLSFEFHRFSGEGDPFGAELLSQQVDGIIVVPRTQYCIDFLNQLDSCPVPLVSFHRRLSNPKISQIYVDNEEAAYRATMLLHGFGHRRIGFIAYDEVPSTNQPNQERLSGYRKALRERGITEQSERVVSGRGPQLVSDVAELLCRTDRPTAIIVAGGMITHSAIQAVHQSGLHVPEELSIINFDEHPEAQNYRPPLTVVKQPLGAGSKMALEHLLAQMEQPKLPPLCVGLTAEIIVRGSCGFCKEPA